MMFKARILVPKGTKRSYKPPTFNFFLVLLNLLLFFTCLLWPLALCNASNVSTSASDWLERLVSKMTCNVLMGTLNPTQSLNHSELRHLVVIVIVRHLYMQSVLCLWQCGDYRVLSDCDNLGTAECWVSGRMWGLQSVEWLWQCRGYRSWCRLLRTRRNLLAGATPPSNHSIPISTVGIPCFSAFSFIIKTVPFTASHNVISKLLLQYLR